MIEKVSSKGKEGVHAAEKKEEATYAFVSSSRLLSIGI